MFGNLRRWKNDENGKLAKEKNERTRERKNDGN